MKIDAGIPKGLYISPHGKYCPYDKGGDLTTKGNRLAAKENMSAESHKRRMKALYAGWATLHRRYKGEKVMSVKTKKKIKRRIRMRLKETVAKELREVQEIARTKAGAALLRLAKIIEDPLSRDSDAIAASQVMFDRAYGKATQVNLNSNVDANGKATDVTEQELNSRITEALKRVENLAGRAPKAPPSPPRPADIRKLN